MNNILTMPIISLCDIIEYINDGKRCLKEGEALLNAGHVIGCGVNNQIKTEIVGLCLQTSNLKGAPHSVKIQLQSATPKGWICTCSCKAGAGGKCKHIIACLLYLYRNDLDELSCTDLEQAWGQQKKKFRIENMQPVQNFCHVKQLKTSSNASTVDNELLENIFKEFLCGSPNSEAALHYSQCRRPLLDDLPKDLHIQESNEKALLKKALTLNLTFKCLWNLPLPVTVNSNDTLYFNTNVKIGMEDAIKIALETIGQNNSMWKRARQCRITSSRCYELYTYWSNKSPNWDKKITSFIQASFKGNKYTRHGTTYEPEARATYENDFGKVHQVGLIINPLFPWLACSPDGLKMYKNFFYRLIEIKCPFLGSKQSIKDIVDTLPYVKCDFTQPFPYLLNTKHKYYGQVQLSMAILNLELCDFVLYSSCDKQIVVIEVKRDEVFIKDVLSKLQSIYFNFLLPKLSLDFKN